MSALEQMLQHLKQPEYVHVLVNPLPVYATAMGVLAIVIALFLRSRQAEIVALSIVLCGCGSAFFAIRTGHNGYDRVRSMSNSDGQEWLHAHMLRAERFEYFFYAVAALALLAIVVPLKNPKAAKPLVLATLVGAFVAMSLAGWISQAGGAIRHSEFRDGLPSAPPTVHHGND